MNDDRPERRRYPRVLLGSGTKGQANAAFDVVLVNISLGGAMIEHAEVVRPGTILDLIATLAGRDVRVQCRVVRSEIHRSEVLPDGEQVLIFRSGLEFLEQPLELQ
jgi:hypothetical protein